MNFKQKISDNISKKAGRVYRLTFDEVDQALLNNRDSLDKLFFICLVENETSFTIMQKKFEGLHYIIISSSDEKIEDICIDAIDNFWNQE